MGGEPSKRRTTLNSKPAVGCLGTLLHTVHLFVDRKEQNLIRKYGSGVSFFFFTYAEKANNLNKLVQIILIGYFISVVFYRNSQIVILRLWNNLSHTECYYKSCWRLIRATYSTIVECRPESCNKDQQKYDERKTSNTFAIIVDILSYSIFEGDPVVVTLAQNNLSTSISPLLFYNLALC